MPTLWLDERDSCRRSGVSTVRTTPTAVHQNNIATLTDQPRPVSLVDVVRTAPHVLDAILEDRGTWRALRQTCYLFRAAVDARMYQHICIKAICGSSLGHSLIHITRPRGWSLPGFYPREYGPPPKPSLSSRLFRSPLTLPLSRTPFWAPLLANVQVVGLDMGPFSRASLGALRLHLPSIDILRIRLPNRLRPKTDDDPVPLPLDGARSVVLFPNLGERYVGDQNRIDVLSAGRGGCLAKLVSNVFVSLDGGCLFPPVEPFDANIEEMFIIFTLIPDEGDKYNRPDMREDWGSLLDQLVPNPPTKTALGKQLSPRPITLVGIPPSLNLEPLLRANGKPRSMPSSATALFREILADRGADLSLYRFMERVEYTRIVGTRQFELEACWRDE